jgi:hypothetical protein
LEDSLAWKEERMPASEDNCVKAFLNRTALLTAVLAIIAGIFGMHVITAGHSTHSATAASVADATIHVDSILTHHHAGDAHKPARLLDPDRPHSATGSVGECSCCGNCSDMDEMTVSCIPSAKTASLTAPLPGSTVFAAPTDRGTGDAGAARWSYLPTGPSLLELSISRT